MVNPPDEAAPDRKPPRLVTLYIPATFGVLAGVGTRTCECSELLSSVVSTFGVALGTFVFSWPFVMAGYHGYRFFRTLFQRT